MGHLLETNADIMLLNCPHWDLRWPPPGILHVHEALKGNGFRSVFFDVNLYVYTRVEIVSGRPPTRQEMRSYHDLWNPHEDYRWCDKQFIARFLELIEHLARQIVCAAPKTVGFSVSQVNKPFSEALAEAIKKLSPGIHIIFGGFDCLDPELLPSYSEIPDLYVVGEGEITAPALLSALLADGNNAALYDIPGVMVNDEKGHASFRPGTPSQDLDSIIYPHYQDIDLDNYAVNGLKHVLLGTSRGCNWGRCSFCSMPGAFRIRSPENCYEEISYLHREFGVKRFSFTDQDINNDPESLMRLCNLIVAGGLGQRITLGGQLRVSPYSDAEFFRTLRKAGFWGVSFGVESGCNRVLALMKKGITAQMATRNLKAAKSVGLWVGINIIVGFPGETYEDFLETLVWLVEMARDYDLLESLAVAHILRPSYLHEHLEQFQIICDDKFQSTAPTRCCHDWVTTNDPKNTRENRECRREIVLRLVASLGIEIGRPVLTYSYTDMRHLGEDECELWEFVEAKLGMKLSQNRIPAPSKNLVTKWWRYSRRRGVIPAVQATFDFMRRRIEGSV